MLFKRCREHNGGWLQTCAHRTGLQVSPFSPVRGVYRCCNLELGSRMPLLLVQERGHSWGKKAKDP